MKKALLIAAAVMFVASSAFAVAPEIGYLGLFKDDTHIVDPPHNTICPVPAPYSFFDVWLWALPSVRGMIGADYALRVPVGSILMFYVVTKHPDIVRTTGDSQLTGMSIAFGEGTCKTDWVWLYHFQMFNMGVVTPGTMIEIIPHPGVQPPAWEFANCQALYPIEPCLYLTPLYFCPPDPGPLGIQETNWGAIKSLF